MLSAIKFDGKTLHLLDQTLLPHESKWLSLDQIEDVAKAIETMVVRGAPAIGCTAAYGLALAAIHSKCSAWSDFQSIYLNARQRLAQTRPTAVNLFFALKRMDESTQQFSANTPLPIVANALTLTAQTLFDEDLATCKSIGQHGLSLARSEQLSILTHCNTGSLATASYGTALGVIRSLHHSGKLAHVYVDETRPYLQGSRLTAYELKTEGIPFSLNVDSAAAYLMATRKIDWVIVGADRIAANGDTANKIGTYSLAILAKYHKIAFYVAAPLSTFDINIQSGRDIPVEGRPSQEITHYKSHAIAPEGISVTNPSFDITPAELITGIITEHGVIGPSYNDSITKLYTLATKFR